MIKIRTLLPILLCLFMTGCNNKFAKQEYDSTDKIVQMTDRYAKSNSVFNPIDGGYELTVSQFDGRQTLWTDTLEEEQDIEMEFAFSLSAGKAKVVHIDAEGNVTTVIECVPETSTDGFVTRSVSLRCGENRLKIVGYDCKDMELKMLFAVSQ